MQSFHLSAGDHVSFSKTVSESDVYLFAGITGDFSPNHVNKQFMKTTAYGRRIAHGALTVGYMSTASTMIVEKYEAFDDKESPVSLGYDKIRFLAPVFLHDTITVDYRVEEVDAERRRTKSGIVVRNQNDETVAVAVHILKWVGRSS